MNGSFGTAINCIDGRAQLPVIEWVKFNGSVQFVDLITEPGADGVLSRGQTGKTEQIYTRLNTSVQAHSPSLIAVCGHADCIGNPVPNEEHHRDIEEASAMVSDWFPAVRVVGLFVNDFGSVDKICDTSEGIDDLKSYL